MSEFLRAAREKIRGALADLDGRLAELAAEQAQLQDHRAQLLQLLDGRDAAATPSLESRTRPAPAATPAPAPAREKTSGRSRAPQATGIFRVDAANRVLAYLEKHGPGCTPADLVDASKVSRPTFHRVITDLLASKQIVRTGKRVATRYRLPGQDAPADQEGDRGARHAARSR